MLCVYPPVYLPINLTIRLDYPSNYLFIFPSMYVSIYLSVYLSVCLKGRNSARLPPKVAGDRCKTRLFCEMFSIFELDSVTIDAILLDFKF